jgi:hypothetical protein
MVILSLIFPAGLATSGFDTPDPRLAPPVVVATGPATPGLWWPDQSRLSLRPGTSSTASGERLYQVWPRFPMNPGGKVLAPGPDQTNDMEGCG